MFYIIFKRSDLLYIMRDDNDVLVMYTKEEDIPLKTSIAKLKMFYKDDVLLQVNKSILVNASNLFEQTASL